MRLSDFEGQWQLSRRIEDKTGLGVGLMQGTAVFHRIPDGLRYEEDGELCFGTQPPMRAQRSYLWRPEPEYGPEHGPEHEGPGVQVLFSDGRPFHRIDLSQPAPKAAHWCDPDHYDVNYDFGAWPEWHCTWQVSGPSKDYRMTTRYRRVTP